MMPKEKTSLNLANLDWSTKVRSQWPVCSNEGPFHFALAGSYGSVPAGMAANLNDRIHSVFDGRWYCVFLLQNHPKRLGVVLRLKAPPTIPIDPP